MIASATHLCELDSVQKMTKRLCGLSFPFLGSHHEAGALGLV